MHLAIYQHLRLWFLVSFSLPVSLCLLCFPTLPVWLSKLSVLVCHLLVPVCFLYFVFSFSSVCAPQVFYSSANFPDQLLFFLHLQYEPTLECSIVHDRELQAEAAVAIAVASVANLTY